MTVLSSFQLSFRAALSAALSTFVASSLGLPHPVYAAISSIVVIELKSSETRRLAFPRVAGTLLGGIFGASWSMWWGPGYWQIAAVIFLSMCATYLVRIPQAAKLAGYVSAIVFMNFGNDPWVYAVYRVVETLLGISASMALSCIPLLLPVWKDR